MLLPHVPASDVFYMRQLWFYPFCIHKGSVSKSYFYVFDEVTGRKSPNEVISCLHDFIKKYIGPEVTTLYVFSDNCAAQNKNAVLVQFGNLCYCKKISHRYPELGHSFLPCDRSFGLVGKEKRKKEGNIKNKSGAKFHISKYKILEFNDKHKETVMCSELASGLLSESFTFLKKSCVPIFPEANDNVYVAPLPLKQAKLLNAMELGKEYVGKAEMWYYRQLEPADTEEECLTSETEDEDE
nr:unnamed protein product [Callosobruchus analis]